VIRFSYCRLYLFQEIRDPWIAQVGERTSPGLLTLAVGLASGSAGVVGLGLAWNELGVAVGDVIDDDSYNDLEK